MKKNTHNRRLTLERIVLAIEILRLANKLIELLSMTINYFRYHEPKMGFKI